MKKGNQNAVLILIVLLALLFASCVSLKEKREREIAAKLFTLEGCVISDHPGKYALAEELISDYKLDINDFVVKSANTRPRFIITTAISRKRYNFVKFMLEKGADITLNGTENLCWAAATGSMELVDLCLSKGVDVNASYTTEADYGQITVSKTRTQCTNALFNAVKFNQYETVALLKDKGAVPTNGTIAFMLLKGMSKYLDLFEISDRRLILKFYYFSNSNPLIGAFQFKDFWIETESLSYTGSYTSVSGTYVTTTYYSSSNSTIILDGKLSDYRSLVKGSMYVVSGATLEANAYLSSFGALASYRKGKDNYSAIVFTTYKP